MTPFPHRYHVSVDSAREDGVCLSSAQLPDLLTGLPPEFGGEAPCWSPETLLVGAMADCYVLTFRGLSGRSNLAWDSISCDAIGVLDRVDGVTRFVEFQLHVRLQTPAEASESLAARVLTKAEEACLVARSVCAATHLTFTIDREPSKSPQAVCVGGGLRRA